MYDKLADIKNNLRNFYAHGAFGKSGETFMFHSATGAVPVNINSSISNRKTYSIHGGKGFNIADAIKQIEIFIDQVLWKYGREPAKIYLMESGLPIILEHANDSKYENAMKSEDSMNDFLQYLSYIFDNAANMDW